MIFTAVNLFLHIIISSPSWTFLKKNFWLTFILDGWILKIISTELTNILSCNFVSYFFPPFCISFNLRVWWPQCVFCKWNVAQKRKLPFFFLKLTPLMILAIRRNSSRKRHCPHERGDKCSRTYNLRKKLQQWLVWQLQVSSWEH